MTSPRVQKKKQFFFEKKNQKAFNSFVQYRQHPGEPKGSAKWIKVFCSFFQKIASFFQYRAVTVNVTENGSPGNPFSYGGLV
jgi:hypothetical protein